MIDPTLRACALSALLVLSGCGGDDESSSGTFGTLHRDTALGELDDDGASELCEATDELRAELLSDDEVLRGACLMQIAGDIEIGLINLDLSPDRYSVEGIIEDCEAALARCLDEGPMHEGCRSIDFEPSCQATVGDYERCMAGTLSASRDFAGSDCETYTRSDAVRDRVLQGALTGLSACTQQLVDCDAEVDPPEVEDPSWSDGGFGRIEEDAGVPDTASNAEWLAELEADVAALERPECDAQLEHEPALDELAAMIAADPSGEIMLGLEVLAQWKWVRADSLEHVRERIQAFLDEEASACTWLSYGLAVDGEPGESRSTVLLITE